MSAEPKATRLHGRQQGRSANSAAAIWCAAAAREVVEGKARSRIVVIEFPSYEAALACYRSPDYQAVKKLREGKAEVDLIIVEGYDGPRV